MTDRPTTTAPACTWAQSVASTGAGQATIIEIDITVPGHDEPVPVEIPLAEHDAPGQPTPAHQLARALGQPEGMTLETLLGCVRDVVADRARISREWELLVREGDRERAAHEEHRQQLADALGEARGHSWDHLIGRAEQIESARGQLVVELDAKRPGDALWVRTYGEEIHSAQQRAETAEAQVRDYENRINWETTCGEHARLLDACRAADERAEKAETALADARAAQDRYEEEIIGRFNEQATKDRRRAEIAEQDARCAMEQRQEMAAERYAWQQRAEISLRAHQTAITEATIRAEAAEATLERVRDLLPGNPDNDRLNDVSAADVRAALGDDQPAEPQPVSTAPLASGLPLVQGHCPACGGTTLFVGSGGYITCSLLDCADPEAATKLLEQDPRRNAEPGGCRQSCAGAPGLRGLLEHAGIDTTGRDITVDGKTVDAAAPHAVAALLAHLGTVTTLAESIRDALGSQP